MSNPVTVYQQLTTGRIHRRKNCGVTSRTRYGHVERELEPGMLRTDPRWCERCWSDDQRAAAIQEALR